MVEIFRVGEENTAARCDHRARILTLSARKRSPSRQENKVLKSFIYLQSSALGSLRPGRRRAKLTVFAPRRFALLARTQIPGTQTIPFKQDRL
jgi:hypothetical protein